MENLSDSFAFIINKEIEIILDYISEDYSINRQDLNKYLLVLESLRFLQFLQYVYYNIQKTEIALKYFLRNMSLY